MNVRFDKHSDTYYIKEKIDNQTYQMEFQRYDRSLDTDYYNVCLFVYSKRKDIEQNEVNCVMTGKNPMATIVFARKAFEMLEDYIIKNGKRARVSVWGSDHVRRKVYERFLMPKGYSYGFVSGLRCLQKIYN